MKKVDNCMVYCPYQDGLVYYTIGVRNVTKIDYNEPRGEGDRHFVDITIGNATTRYFNIKAITFIESN